MKLFGIIGKPLSHSFSEKYFNEKFQREDIDALYKNFPLESISDFNTVIDQGPVGLNVTFPYKELVMPFLDELDKTASGVGAVNTIKISYATGKPYSVGYNTDIYGFEQSLKPFLEPQHQKALILGTGGASKAVYYVLKNLGVDCLFVSRKPDETNQISYQQLNSYIIENYKLIVNTTPLGMYPDSGSFPEIPYQNISEEHLCYDLIYNPEKTEFLKKSEEQGAVILNGLQMLHFQADKAWEIWNT